MPNHIPYSEPTLVSATPPQITDAYGAMSPEDREELGEWMIRALMWGIRVLPTGSQVIGGATEDSDWDFVLDPGPNLTQYTIGRDLLRRQWMEPEIAAASANAADRGSQSYRFGKLNFIVVHDTAAMQYWARATEVARVLGCETKQERIAVFDDVFQGDNDAANRLFQVRANGRTAEQVRADLRGAEEDIPYETESPDTFL